MSYRTDAQYIWCLTDHSHSGRTLVAGECLLLQDLLPMHCLLISGMHLVCWVWHTIRTLSNSKDISPYVYLSVHLHSRDLFAYTHTPTLIYPLNIDSSNRVALCCNFIVYSVTLHPRCKSAWNPYSLLLICLFVCFAGFSLTFTLFGCLRSHWSVILLSAKKQNALKSLRIL